MKKTMTALLAALLVAGLLGSPALAYGGQAKGRRNGIVATDRQALRLRDETCERLEVCALDDCTVMGPHLHDGVWYCGQALLHDSLEPCPVGGCAIRGAHEHYGVYYCCASCNTCPGPCFDGAGGGAKRGRK